MEERRRYGPRRGRFGRQERRGFIPKPVEVGKEYDVTIEEVSSRGEGVARVQGLVIFVPNREQGDHVKIRVTRISRRFAEAEAIGEVNSASKRE
jgi:predicted RNA-binding protein with TRAM domain